MEGFWFEPLHPSGNSSFGPDFPSIILILETPLFPLKFPITLLGAGMDIVWDYTVQNNFDRHVHYKNGNQQGCFSYCVQVTCNPPSLVPTKLLLRDYKQSILWKVHLLIHMT